jgi:hypothetical protein
MPKKTIDEASIDMSYNTFSFREAAILKYLPKAEQVADILTKPLEGNIFSFLRDKLGFSRGGVLA